MVKHRLSFATQTAIVILQWLVLGVILVGCGFLYSQINAKSGEFIPVLPTELRSGWHLLQLVLVAGTLVLVWFIRQPVEDWLTLKLVSPSVRINWTVIFWLRDSLNIVATDPSLEPTTDLRTGYLNLLQAGSLASDDLSRSHPTPVKMSMSGTESPHWIIRDSVAASG